MSGEETKIIAVPDATIGPTSFPEQVAFNIARAILVIARRMDADEDLQSMGGVKMRPTKEGPVNVPFPTLREYARELRLVVSAVVLPEIIRENPK